MEIQAPKLGINIECFATEILTRSVSEATNHWIYLAHASGYEVNVNSETQHSLDALLPRFDR